MPSSDDRFYQLEFRNRPVRYGDIGSLLKISGLIVTGGGAEVHLYLPSYSPVDMPDNLKILWLTDEEWNDFIHRSDDPEILIGPAKIFQRKVRWEVSGAVQQKVWAKDGFMCAYCGAKMGNAQLTVDHFIPLELGGKNDTSNYLSACRKCNKDKGSEDPRTYCERKGWSYDAFADYLKNRKIG